jgi:TPR repeat protein
MLTARPLPPLASPIALCFLLCSVVGGTASLRAQYAPPDQRTVYDSWIRESQSRRSSSFKSAPQTDQAAAFRAAHANDRFIEQRNRIFAEQNAAIARQNARNAALQADYDRLAALGQQAKEGSVLAMRQYGFELMKRGDSNARTKEIGRAWVQAASDMGDSESKQWLQQQTAAREPEREEAEKKARDAAYANTLREAIGEAKAGNVHSMRWLGLQYYFQGTPEQRKLSDEWRQQAIEHNDIPMLEFLIDRTRWGDGTPEELAEGLALRLRLAGLPNQPAMSYQVGDIYLTGRFGVKIDRATAVPHLEKAAAEGNLDARFRLAEAFAHGIGGPLDAPAAIRNYQAALAQKLPGDYAKKTAAARLALAALMLDPKNDPKAHAPEILQVVDDGFLEPSEDGDALARLASDALASGQLGIDDQDRELLYASRRIRYAEDWTDAQDLADRALALGSAVIERSAEPDHPLFIVEQKRTPVVEFGAHVTRVTYEKVIARPRDVFSLLMFAVRKAPKPEARAFLLAGSVAEDIGEKELAEKGWGADLAFELYDAAATRFDDARGWLESGRLQLNGSGVERDPVKAQARLQTAWEKGEARAALTLAAIQQKNMVSGATPQGALDWIQRGAAKHERDCMQHWGTYLVTAAQDKNLDPAAAKAKADEGRDWLQKAADAGSPQAMVDLSDLYATGSGVPPDEAKVVALLRQAVALNWGPAKRDLADRLANGRGVDQDQKLALKLLYEAAHTDLKAANNLGVILWRGTWGEKDVDDGLRWMEVTLRNGFWVSGRNLAKIHHLGLGVEANEDKARAYLEQAGDADGAESALGVAELYERGEVITKDPEAARRWREKAATYAQAGG